MAEEELDNAMEGDEEGEESSAKQKITSIATEAALDEILNNPDLVNKKVIIVSWLLPDDQRCNQLMVPMLKKMREEHIMILVANPATLPERAQKIGLFAVPTFQFYRKSLIHTLVGTNQAKFQGFFKSLYRDLQEEIKAEQYIERSAPTENSLSSGERTEPEVPTFTLGIGCSPSVFEAEPPVAFDILAFLVTESGKALSDQHLVSVSHPALEGNNCLSYSRNPTDRKNKEEDDIIIEVALEAVEPTVLSIVLVAAIQRAEEREQNLELVSEMYLRAFDREQKKVLFLYPVTTTGMTESAAVIGKLERAEEGSQSWEFAATVENVEGGYDGVLTKFLEVKTKKKKK